MPRNPFAYYRRALSVADKEAFDRLMERASKHKEGKVLTFRMDRLIQGIDQADAVFLTILLEHEKEIIELRNRSMGQVPK